MENEDALREALENLLIERGYRVWAATNARSAIDILKVKPVNVIVSDVIMPKGDGVLILKYLNGEPEVNVPVIFLTGFSAIHRNDLIAQGAFEVLDKPSRFKVLATKIEQALASISQAS